MTLYEGSKALGYRLQLCVAKLDTNRTSLLVVDKNKHLMNPAIVEEKNCNQKKTHHWNVCTDTQAAADLVAWIMHNTQSWMTVPEFDTLKRL